MDKRTALVDYLKLLIGSVYKWGGDGPYNVGFDCSGLVLEGLASIGLWGKGDTTSQGIYNHFSPTSNKKLPSKMRAGDLLFFGKDLSSITHIAVALNPSQYIEAGGGDSKTVNEGMVRIRHIYYRKDLAGVLDVIKD